MSPADEDVKLWQFQTGKRIQPGETKWMKKQMWLQKNVRNLSKRNYTDYQWKRELEMHKEKWFESWDRGTYLYENKLWKV